jgi:hypothetical protein
MKKEKTDQEIAELKEKLKNQEETEKPKTETTQKTAPKTEKTFPITRQEAEDLVTKWENAQMNGNWNDYKSLYAPQFTGIKRTSSGKVSQMNQKQWLNDRQKMWKNILGVSVAKLNITIDGNTAIADFEQDFQSKNYGDRGQKILKIQKFSDGVKIIREEMKSSN